MEDSMETTMTRRTFAQRAAKIFSAAAILCVGGTIMTGCILNAANVKSLINMLITSIQNILKVATNAPWASDLSAALAALQSAEQNWSAGGAVTLIDDALNTVTAVLAAIPLTAVYSPLVDIIVAGIEAVLSVIPVTPAVTRLRGVISSNPHYGRIVLNKPNWRHETPQGAYKAQWNGLCKQIGLPQAEL
jgi:hypothetical protein